MHKKKKWREGVEVFLEVVYRRKGKRERIKDKRKKRREKNKRK